MKISIVTLFPNMISGFFEESIVKRAQEKELVEIEFVDLRKFAIDNYGSVDDRPYGGGPGMVLRVDVIYKALESLRGLGVKKSKTVLTSPKGKVFAQKKAQEFSKLNHLVILSGHYEAVDERVRDYVDEEVSLGDFVLTGGEIVASAITDTVVRLIPGVLEKETATQVESFFEVSLDDVIGLIGEDETLKKLKEKGVKKITLLEYPHYTRPEDFKGKKVPKILLSGNHKEIEGWRLKKAYEETLKKRQDLFK